jgi:hypothetical protein
MATLLQALVMMIAALSRLLAIGVACGALAGPVAAQQTPRASPAVQTEFNTFFRQFREALKANDAAATAALTRFPLYYDGDLRDAAHFQRSVFRRLFNARNRNCLQTARASYDRDGNGADTYSAFCGEQMFVFTKGAEGFRFSDIGVND